MKYDILFWDLDGTIIDSYQEVATGLDKLFEHYGMTVDKSLYNHFIGPPLRRSFPLYFGEGDKLEEALNLFREYYNPNSDYAARLFPGIDEVLTELKRKNYRMFVATSKKEDNAIAVLKKLGVFDRFEKVFGANDLVGIIEKEDVLDKAFEEYAFDKSKCLMIGDTMYDVRGAKYIGIDCMVALYGFGDNEELLASDIIGSVDAPEDILNIL